MFNNILGVNVNMIIFHTENLNKRLYRGMINNILINLGTQSVYRWLTKWDIHIHPLREFPADHFEGYKTADGKEINFDMAWGITGQRRMDLYLEDIDNQYMALQNSTVVQHEICHAKLQGTDHFVDGVHDNVENTFPISFWYWDKWRWRKMTILVIDIRQFL